MTCTRSLSMKRPRKCSTPSCTLPHASVSLKITLMWITNLGEGDFSRPQCTRGSRPVHHAPGHHQMQFAISDPYAMVAVRNRAPAKKITSRVECKPSMDMSIIPHNYCLCSIGIYRLEIRLENYSGNDDIKVPFSGKRSMASMSVVHTQRT